LNYFPHGDEEIELIKFIAKYQYLKVTDTKYFFSSSRYYRERIRKLIEKKYLRKVKNNLILDKAGIEYAMLSNFEYNKRNRNEKYLLRLLYLSHLAAFYHNSTIIKFKPSFDIKDKECFTITARRFIGILNINGIEYLTYSITSEHDTKYIKSIIYDIQKEMNYQNIIVLVDDISRINIIEFTFGINQVLVIEDTEENREKLKYLHSVNWNKVLEENYKTEVFLAEYNFCSYTDYKNKYISIFYFLDTEKINRIKYFLRENNKKNMDIICSSELKERLKVELPTACYITVNLEKYIEKERKYYD
jgi:hypothetical protein